MEREGFIVKPPRTVAFLSVFVSLGYKVTPDYTLVFLEEQVLSTSVKCNEYV